MTFDEWFAKEYHEQVAVEGEDGLRDLLTTLSVCLLWLYIIVGSVS